MAIQIKAPDGSIAQFPDGTPDSAITAAMAKAYPQPSTLDRIAASPIGRFAHDAVVAPVVGISDLLTKAQTAGLKLPSGYGDTSPVIEKPYQGALARNRNTPGYAAARQQADAMMAANGGSGLSDQFIAPFAPAVAGTAGLFGGGLDRSNAAADAQAQAQGQYAAAHPVLSTAAQLAGGALAVPEGGPAAIPAAIPKQPVPSLASLNAAKKAAYATVDNSSMKIAQPAVKDLYDTVSAQLSRMGLNDKTIGNLAPKTATALDALKDASNTEQTLQGMDVQRRIAGIAAGAPDKTDRTAARILQDHIDNFVGNLTPQQLSGPVDQAAIDALPQARDLAQRSFKAQTIQSLLDKAQTNATGFGQSGLENSIRSQFRKLANNDRGMARFSPDEQEAIRRVATGGSAYSANNLLRDVGKLAPYGALPLILEGQAAVGAGLAGGLGGLAASTALPAAGAVGRAGATALTKAAAQKALDLTLLGKTRLPVLPQPVLQRPMLPQSLPLGLFGAAGVSAANGQ